MALEKAGGPEEIQPALARHWGTAERDTVAGSVGLGREMGDMLDLRAIGAEDTTKLETHAFGGLYIDTTGD